jgi:N-sulfoglucosamine sulfohydrolase
MKYSQILLSFFLIYIFAGCTVDKRQKVKPNIVWIMLEDWGYQLSCYGEPGIQTPFVDQVAASGMRFTNAFCTAPVCSPSRSAMITGFHQNYINAHQHRTNGSGFEKAPLPHGIRPITHLLEDAGLFHLFYAKQKNGFEFYIGQTSVSGQGLE